ncbi:Ger(x)C family spore germination protein [Haloimpatiens sp. FM7330]|uniref:Ger(x)C family spore germination protein n=1 Tax=Haloimpatiens sp. FM7330 TaxID=3298610 RepID=UPI0036322A49
MFKRFNKFIIILVLLAIFLYTFIGSKGQILEKLDIPVAVGNDLIMEGKSNLLYSVPIALYIFEHKGDITSHVLTGKAHNIGETRESRNLKSNRKFLLGIEKVFLMNEDFAKLTLSPLIDILLNNPLINDNALVVVCKQSCEDILNYKVKGYPNSGDYIEGMLKHLGDYAFFSPQNTIMDLIERLDSEGRNTVLPYLELKKFGLEVTGLALFKGDKMIGKINVKDAKILNLLKFNNVKGMLSIQNNANEYINYYATSKKKVKCSKIGEKYKFTINLNLKGTIVNNELYKNFNKDPQVLKNFEKDIENSVEKIAYDFFKEYKHKYDTDILGLGKFAVAKYGRHKGIDWNEAVCNSDIEVHVKASVDKQGRGDF